MKHLSKRVYQIVFLEGNSVVNMDVPLNRLYDDTKNDFEYIYSMQEEIDNILNLKVNEVMYCQFNRDDSSRKGVLRRKK